MRSAAGFWWTAARRSRSRTHGSPATTPWGARGRTSSGTTPTGSGGGIYQSGGGGSLALVGGTVIKANSVASGGGIASTLGAFTDNGAVIQANTATVAGAGFYASQNTRAINFTNAKISSNAINATGVANGGGLYISEGTLNTNGFTVKNNKDPGRQQPGHRGCRDLRDRRDDQIQWRDRRDHHDHREQPDRERLRDSDGGGDRRDLRHPQ